MANLESMLAAAQEALSMPQQKAKPKWVSLKWYGEESPQVGDSPDRYEARQSDVLFNGDGLDRDRFRHAAGVPNNNMRVVRASHDRYRDLMGRDSA